MFKKEECGSDVPSRAMRYTLCRSCSSLSRMPVDTNCTVGTPPSCVSEVMLKEGDDPSPNMYSAVPFIPSS